MNLDQLSGLKTNLKMILCYFPQIDQKEKEDLIYIMLE